MRHSMFYKAFRVAGLTVVYMLLIPSLSLADAPFFLWIPLSEVKDKDQVLVKFTYGHDEDLRHDCSVNPCSSRFVVVNEKTAFCRFRTDSSMLYEPGLLKDLSCEPLQQTGLDEVIVADSSELEVQVLAIPYAKEYLQIELRDETVEPWATLSVTNEEDNYKEIVFCFFQQTIHQKTIKKIGFAFQGQDACYRLSADSDPNIETTEVANITHFLSAATQVIPIRTAPVCSYEGIDDNDFYKCSIYKCWPWKSEYSGKDDCTGKCLTEDCIYITHYPYGSSGTERCCQGSSGCYEDCLEPESSVIIGTTVGLGIPFLCLIGTFMACSGMCSGPAECIGEGCKSCYRGVARLFAWGFSGASALAGYCLKCPACCAQQLSSIFRNQESEQSYELPEAVIPEVSAGYTEAPPPSYEDAVNM